jgi:hypothetical protein
MKTDLAIEIEDLIDKYRDRCLWFLRPDFIPRSQEEVLRVLDLIERYGDRAGFERAQRLRQWLLLPTSAES